jgi:hypothetical protein
MKRRKFLRNSAYASLGAIAFSPASYARILGANDRVRVGVVGFSDRFKNDLFPSFMGHQKGLNFEIVAVSDLWKVRRELGQAFLKEKTGRDITPFVNNEACTSLKVLTLLLFQRQIFNMLCIPLKQLKPDRIPTPKSLWQKQWLMHVQCSRP